jgi:hypothetical protein
MPIGMHASRIWRGHIGDTQNARLFIIDPSGSHIIDKRAKGPGMLPLPTTDLMNSLMEAIDGPSRRSPITTYSGDEIERKKLPFHHEAFAQVVLRISHNKRPSYGRGRITNCAWLAKVVMMVPHRETPHG